METAGVMLLRAGLISQDQLAEANANRRRRGGTLGGHLVRLGAVTEDQLVEFYRHRLMVPKVGVDALGAVTKKVIAAVPVDMAAEFRVVPVAIDGEGNLTLAMADPSDTHAVDEVGFFTGHFVMRAVTTESAISWALEKYYGIASEPLPSAAPRPAPSAAPPPAPSAAPPPAPSAAPPPAPSAAPPPAPPAATPPASEVVLLTKPKKRKRAAAAPAAPAPSSTAPPPAAPLAAAPAAPAPSPAAPPPVAAIAAAPAAPAPSPDAPPPPAALEATVAPLVELTPSGRVAGVSTPEAPETSPAAQALTTAIQELRTAVEPEQVAATFLSYFLSFCGRAVFFTVRKGALRVQDAQGEGIETAELRDLAPSLDEPSVFRDVMAGRYSYRGAPDDSPAIQTLGRALPPPSGDVIVIPVAVRHKVVALVYADRIKDDPPEAGMTRVGLEAGMAYERLIAQRKEASGKTTAP